MEIYPLIDPFALKQDGSTPLTNNWNVGGYDITNIAALSAVDLTLSAPSNIYDLLHNSFSTIQGGTTNEYYHLTSAEHDELTDWLDEVVLDGDDGSVDMSSGNLTASNVNTPVVSYTGDIAIAPDGAAPGGGIQFRLVSTVPTIGTAVASNIDLDIIADGTGTVTIESTEFDGTSVTSTGTIQGANLIATSDIIIGDVGYIGSASDPDAMQIEADGDIVMSQDLGVTGVVTAGGFTTAGLFDSTGRVHAVSYIADPTTLDDDAISVINNRFYSAFDGTADNIASGAIFTGFYVYDDFQTVYSGSVTPNPFVHGALRGLSLWSGDYTKSGGKIPLATLNNYGLEYIAQHTGEFDLICRLNFNNVGLKVLVETDGTYTKTSGDKIHTINSIGGLFEIDCTPTVDDPSHSTESINLLYYGIKTNVYPTAPSITSGPPTVKTYGAYLEVASGLAAANGVSEVYGLYLTDVSGEDADTIYSIYSAGGDNYLAGELQAAGGAKIGDGGTTHYAQFAADGEITLAGTARVIKEITIGAHTAHKGSSAPTDTYLATSNAHVLGFSTTTVQHVHFTTLIPEDFAAGTTIDIEIDWSFLNAEADHYVTWVVDYLLLADGEDPDGAMTVRHQKSIISTGNNDKQIHTTFGTGITGAVADDTLSIRFWRDRAGTLDTDDLNQDANYHILHLHYISDKLGKAT